MRYHVRVVAQVERWIDPEKDYGRPDAPEQARIIARANVSRALNEAGITGADIRVGIIDESPTETGAQFCGWDEKRA